MARLPAMDPQAVCDMIQHVWALPLRHGPVVSIRDQDIALMDVPKMNTCVFERAVSQMALQAAQGDVKSFETLMKYGGLQPPTEQHLTIDQPTIIDDISEAKVVPLPEPPVEEEEEKDPPVIEFIDDLSEE